MLLCCRFVVSMLLFPYLCGCAGVSVPLSPCLCLRASVSVLLLLWLSFLVSIVAFLNFCGLILVSLFPCLRLITSTSSSLPFASAFELQPLCLSFLSSALILTLTLHPPNSEKELIPRTWCTCLCLCERLCMY